MRHYISNESCEKEIKEILCVPERKCVSTLGLSIEEINGILMNSEVVVDERKI